MHVNEARQILLTEAQPRERTAIAAATLVRALDTAWDERDDAERRLVIVTREHDAARRDAESLRPAATRAWEMATVADVARAENERLEAVARNAADLLEQKGYDQTASAVRAALDNIVAARPAPVSR